MAPKAPAAPGQAASFNGGDFWEAPVLSHRWSLLGGTGV